MDRAECIITGGTILTPEKAEAVAVAGGRILAVGVLSDLEGLADASTRRVDASGCTVVPGLTDSHMHLLSLGTTLEEADLRGVASLREMTERLQGFIRERDASRGAWIVGRGWDQNRMAERRLPDRDDLDEAFPDVPVLLVRLCAHVAVLNSKALESLPLDELDPETEANFRRRADGNLSGMVVESGLMWVWRRLPEPSEADLKRRYLAGARKAAAAGLTEVHSDDVGSASQLRRAVSVLEALADSGEFPIRIRMKLHARSAKDVAEMLREASALPWRSDRVRRGPVKILLDGSLGARTAALEAPYADAPGENGILSIPEDELREMVARTHDAGSPVAIHIIGDRSARVAIGCIEAAMRRNPRPDPRHRLIHCQIMTPAMWGRMADLGIVADIVLKPAIGIGNPFAELGFGGAVAARFGISDGGDVLRWYWRRAGERDCRKRAQEPKHPLLQKRKSGREPSTRDRLCNCLRYPRRSRSERLMPRRSLLLRCRPDPNPGPWPRHRGPPVR